MGKKWPSSPAKHTVMHVLPPDWTWLLNKTVAANRPGHSYSARVCQLSTAAFTRCVLARYKKKHQLYWNSAIYTRCIHLYIYYMWLNKSCQKILQSLHLCAQSNNNLGKNLKPTENSDFVRAWSKLVDRSRWDDPPHFSATGRLGWLRWGARVWRHHDLRLWLAWIRWRGWLV